VLRLQRKKVARLQKRVARLLKKVARLQKKVARPLKKVARPLKKVARPLKKVARLQLLKFATTVQMTTQTVLLTAKILIVQTTPHVLLARIAPTVSTKTTMV